MRDDYTYVCPHCKKETDWVKQTKKCTVEFEYRFRWQDWDQDGVEDENCKHISFHCPNCNEPLPIELETEIWRHIRGETRIVKIPTIKRE